MHVLADLSARPVIAHRGASAVAPENTLPAFALAVEQGADALEFDVRLTADGVPVVIHDDALDRTTNARGPITAYRAAQLEGIDAGWMFSPDGGRSFPWRGRDARIPTLAEVVDTCPLPLLIELKVANAQDAVRRVLEEHDAVDRCMIASADSAALTSFRDSRFLVGASRTDITRLLLQAYLRVPLGRVAYHALSVPDRYHGLPVPTRRFVAAARTKGCPVHVWTVDDPAIARKLWGKGVAGIVTNVPARMLLARRELGRSA